MSVIGKDVVKVEIGGKYRYEYLEDGSKKWKHIVDDEDRVIDPNEVKTYFTDDMALKIKKDEQGNEVSSEYTLYNSCVTIDKNSGMLCLRVSDDIIFDDKNLEPIKDGYTAPVDLNEQMMVAEYINNKFQGWFVRDKDTPEITGRRDVKYYSNGKKHYDTIYHNLGAERGKNIYKQDIYYHENGNLAGMAISFLNKLGGNKADHLFWEERYNSEGVLTYRVMGCYRRGKKEIRCMEEYDETGTRLIRSAEFGEGDHVSACKHIDYDEEGNPTIIRYKSIDVVGNEKILRIIDNNEKTYPSGQKKFELNADGSKTKFYETGEVLSQTDKDGKETFYYKDGKQRMVIEADGTKNVNYDGGQFLLISGRHCEKDGRGNLSEEGKKQAENIGKIIAYASQGKISGLPHVILPETSSSSGPDRVIETNKIILETINTTLQVDNKCEKVNDRYAIEECNHEANAELSIHSMCEGYDTADDRMGSIAFSVVGRDGFVIDRVVFTAEQIAEQLARVEEQEKLKQETKSKIEAFKEETLAQQSEDKAKSRIAWLHKLIKGNATEETEATPHSSNNSSVINSTIRNAQGNEGK